MPELNDFDKGYADGSDAAWRAILTEALRNLNAPNYDRERLLSERAEMISVLREFVEIDDDDYLPDVLRDLMENR